MVLFLKSLLLGLAVAAPVGPVGMLCITRTMTRGFWFGFSGGAGVAFADAFYAVVAATMFAVVAEFITGVNLTASIIGGVIIVIIGLSIMQAKPVKVAAKVTAGNIAASMASAFALTLLNPMTVLLFVAVFAGLGLGDDLTFLRAFMVVLGVFAGSLLWWFMLCGGIAMVRRRLSDNFALWVTRISGVLVTVFGVGAIIGAIVKWH